MWKKKKSKMMRDAEELQRADRAKKLEEVNTLIERASVLSNSNKAIEIYQRAIDLGERINEKSEVAKAYLGAGIGYQSIGDFPKAEQYLKKSSKLFEQAGQPTRAGNVNSKLSRVPKQGKRLLEKIGLTAAIIGFLGSVFFMTNGFTGYAIAEINQQGPSLFGVVLFLIGIVGLYFWTSRR